MVEQTICSKRRLDERFTMKKPFDLNLLYVFLSLNLNCQLTEAKVFTLGLLAPFQKDYEFSARTSASAVSIAVDLVNGDPELNANGQIELRLIARDTACSSKQALGEAVDLWYNETVDAFLGPPCSVACRSVAEMASVLGIPLISWVATDADLTDRRHYSTLSRTLGPFDKMAGFLLEIIAQYKWRRVVIISSRRPLFADAAEAMTYVFLDNNITIPYHGRHDRLPAAEQAVNMLYKASLVGRIIFLINPKEDRRLFMLSAFDLGMCEGEFVFYTIDMLPDNDVSKPESVWKGSDHRDADARKAFESVFHVGLAALTNKEVTLFREEVGRLNRLPPWNFSLNPGEQLKKLTNQNVNVFIGASIDPPNICLYWQYCDKGSLLDLLNNDNVRLDDSFRMSFMTDIAKGMIYLHISQVVVHGRLKSSNCLVDSKWMVKVTDYGMPTFFSQQDYGQANQDEMYRKMMWTAPEILREDVIMLRGTQPGDVYSFAIICHEIFTRKEPYCFDNMTPRDVINRVRSGEDTPFRPPLPQDVEISKKMLKLIRLCWDEEAEERPTFLKVKAMLVKMAGGEINILDTIIKTVESYSNKLEEIVAERTQELAEEKKKTDLLLYKILPPSVAEQLKSGLVVTPENFHQSSIYFSDIVGFTTLSADSTPMEIVDFLNDLYVCFDDILTHHDVYKVETVGDAYMIVSGVPLRNGNKHVTEIANCSLDLLSAVTGFTIRHRPDQKLQIRIGVHTGAVVTGVVGLMMPRYCLFGDTVTIAAKMESTGKPLRIHISKASYLGLKDSHDGYETMKRREINLMKSGLNETYWLYGKKGFDKPLPVFNRNELKKEF